MFEPSLPIPTVNVFEARNKTADGALLIDVREQLEWDESRIPGAELRPLSTANSWYEELPQDGDIVFYCRSGSRSGQIVQALVDQVGMANVFNMAGGIIAWAEAELPLAT
jgi:rhodanese-related sulfurtransferase